MKVGLPLSCFHIKLNLITLIAVVVHLKNGHMVSSVKGNLVLS